jgi:glycosyltransferase involved in cell wall biosynthesis
MDKTPLVSVIMPAYNCDGFIGLAIESILNQSLQDFELIIVYDKSTDNTLNIIENYQASNSKIVVSVGKNRGLINSLNDGLKIARGFYIARMDADDISLPNRLEIQTSYMQLNRDVGVSGSWIEIIDPHGIKLSVWRTSQTNEDLKACLLFSVPFAHPSVMIRSELLNEHNIAYDKNSETVEDYKLWLELSAHAKFASIPEVLLQYRYLENSLSKTADKNFNRRFKSTQKVFKQSLLKLNMLNTKEEDTLHFIISLNDRLLNYFVKLSDLNKYLQKIIKQNKKFQVFDESSLKMLLQKKFLIVVYYKCKKMDITVFTSLMYGMFWKALFKYLMRKYR